MESPSLVVGGIEDEAPPDGYPRDIESPPFIPELGGI
jgi:hypothetical protein